MTGETETNGFAFLFCKKKCAGWQEPAGSRGAAGELVEGKMISDRRLHQLIQLIKDGKEHLFYLWSEWKNLAAYVRRLDNNECQICKAKGKYKKGIIVHHIKHLRDRPDLALSVYDPNTGERQLITICKQCHEDEHPEALKQFSKSSITNEYEERWD